MSIGFIKHPEILPALPCIVDVCFIGDRSWKHIAHGAVFVMHLVDDVH